MGILELAERVVIVGIQDIQEYQVTVEFLARRVTLASVVIQVFLVILEPVAIAVSVEHQAILATLEYRDTVVIAEFQVIQAILGTVAFLEPLAIQVFLEHQGFDDGYSVPCIEDIELGNRLVRAGVRIALAPEIQAQHLKRWTFLRMVVTDILHRGLPWTRLILASGRMPNDLNLCRSSRASVVLVMLACALAVWTAGQALAVPGNAWTGGEVLALAGLLAGASALNWRFTRFLAAKRGWRFAVAAVPLHWVYFVCCGVSFGLGLAGHLTAKLAVRLGLRAAAAETGGLSG